MINTVFALFLVTGSWLISTMNEPPEWVEHFESAHIDTLNHVPTAFSPNGDGENDTFQIKIDNHYLYDSTELWIFNRWGEYVFSTKRPEIGWDGNTLEGNEVPTGSYVYLLRLFFQGDTTKFHGHVVLLR